MPQPGVIAGALARETKNCKIAILGRALPLVNYPLAIAEEFAMLDAISGGRIIAGFVRGIGAEYHAMGVNPAFSHARYLEAHDLILRAWTEPGPFEFEGKHYHFKYVNTWPRPVQQPASADLDSVAGQQRDNRLGGRSFAQIHLPADVQPDRPAAALSWAVQTAGGKERLGSDAR